MWPTAIHTCTDTYTHVPSNLAAYEWLDSGQKCARGQSVPVSTEPAIVKHVCTCNMFPGQYQAASLDMASLAVSVVHANSAQCEAVQLTIIKQ